ncbi:MAG: WG repeat-containing protein [Achromobacter sp.]|uniref:WG repeat-containing protein n=1 Tax=Achromobacter sp. TaxID=134375 RepID=UPI003CFEDB63
MRGTLRLRAGCRPALRPLALAAALACLGPAPASADEYAGWQRDCVGRTYAITPDVSCQRGYAEGLAAVITGKAGDPAGTWGYIDPQGGMVIKPAFQEAESFQNGLAAVRQGDLWGYIDQRGNWAIEPRFTRASGFNAEGTALVEQDERDVLINRQGQVLKTFALGTRSWGFERGQKLAEMEVPQPPRLFNTATGRALTLPADVMMLAPSDSGYLPAQRRSSRYGGWWGLLDADGRWAIAPDVLRSQQPPLRDGDTLAVQRDDTWRFVRPDGTALDGDGYESVTRVAPGLWLVKPKGQGPYALLDAQLKPLHTFTNPYVGVEATDDWKVLSDIDAVILIPPNGKPQVVRAAFGRVTVSHGLAWVNAQQPSAARADSAVPAAAAAAADAAQAVQVTAAADAAVSADAGGDDTEATLAQIYRADGTPLLDAGTVERLAQYRVTPFSPRRDDKAQAEALPLALLHPHDYSQPTGILTRSGRIVTNPEWDDISSYDASAPLLVQTRKRTVGAIDAEGNWILPPRFAGIGGFKGAYAWARTPDMDRDAAVLIDTRGNPQKLPARIEVNGDKLDGDLLYFHAVDGRRDRRWGLWNIRGASEVVKPMLERIEDFTDDWAKAQDHDRWGVIDRQGKWVVPATYSGSYELDYLGNGYLLAREPRRADDTGYGDAYRLIDLRTGKRSAVLHERPQDLKRGRYLAQGTDGATLLFDAQGGMTRLFEGEPERQEQFGDWIYVQYRSRNGAIDARGNFKVPAVQGEFNPFFVQPEGLARVFDGQRYRLMDENGKTLLAARGDGTPLASMKRVVFRDSKNSQSVMTDLQGREITRLQGEFTLEERNASEGVVVYRGQNDRYGFVNADGKRVVGPYFDRLGPLRDGLALARREQRSGKLLGYIDLTGRYVIPPTFGWADDFSEGRALVRREGLLQFIDKRGATMTLFGLICGEVVVFDAQGRLTWPREKLTCPDARDLEYAPAPESAQAQ